MSEQKRQEATHRQRAALAEVAKSWPLNEDGSPMAMVSTSCSDLIPTVQFGNVMVGPVTITRFMRSDGTFADGLTSEQVNEATRKQLANTEYIVGAERRVIQWALDPASRVVNPGNGHVLTPDGERSPADAAAMGYSDPAAEPAQAAAPAPEQASS